MSQKASISVGLWIGITFVGWFLGVAVLLLISGVVEVLLPTIGLQFQLGMGIGIGMGLIQYFVLRKRMGIGFEWFWASLIGIGLPFIVFDILHLSMGWKITPNYTMFVGGSISGLLSGLFYYRILQKHQYQKAHLFFISNFLGWISSVVSLKLIDYTNYANNHGPFVFFINLFLILFGGFALGTFNGLALKSIQKNSPNKTMEKVEESFS